MMVSNFSFNKEQDIEKGEATQEQSSFCPWTRRTWRKIVIGSIVTTNLSSIAVVISGLIVNNNLIVAIGLGSGVTFSATGLFAHLLTRECTDPEDGT